MTMAKIPPPAHEGRLMPIIIDDLALNNPNKPWASVPYDDDDLSKGYEDIGYGKFANAINKLSWIIEALLGKSTTFETITYYGVPDLRYHMMQMAACKTGHVVLFSSHLNSLDVHMGLMERLNCKALFYSSGVQVDDILGARPMARKMVPELNDLLDLNDMAKVYPYSKVYKDSAYEPYMYIHTSGTTGNPKPVEVTHAMLYALTMQNVLPDVEGRYHHLDYVQPGRDRRVILPVAPYHGISSLGGLISTVLGGGVFVMPYRNRAIMPSDPVAEILLLSKATHAFLVPYIMETVARMPDPGKYIRPFTSASYGGGVLSKSAQEIWSKYTKIQNCFGATEIGFPPQLVADPGDEEYIYFDLKHGCLEFQEVKLDDYEDGENTKKVFEMVLVYDPEWAQYSGYFSRECGKYLPPYKDHHVGDLWTPHPDPKKAHFVFKFAGRIDDVITLSTGVNVNTGTVEKALLTHKLVKAALVVGNRRLQPLALVELVPDADPESAVKEIWESVIEPLNEKMQSQARIASTHVLVVPPMGLVRTVKGTVSKLKSERKLEKEIDEVYRKFGDVYHGEGRDETNLA